MTASNEEKTGTDRQKATAQGCSLLTLLVLASFWVLGGTALALVFTWTVEQAILDASFVVSDVRFFVFLAYGGIMVFALLIVTLWTRLPHMKAVFRTWMLAAILALILAPVRLLPILAGQLTALFQMVGLFLFILGLWLLLVRPAEGAATTLLPKSGWQGVGMALLIAAIIGIPWVWIGAFGSILDTLLALGVALLFGIAASMLISYSLLRDLKEAKQNYSNVDYASDGFAAAMTLLILVTALGQNGNQWVLALVIPVLGWAAVGVAAIGRHINASSNWPAVAVLIGLAIAWPLMLIEPTELSLRLTGTPGELTGWVLRAAQYSLWLALLINVGVALLLRKIFADQYSQRWVALGAAVSGLALIVVYFVLGQPGFHGDHIFIVMRQQADLSQAAAIDDYNERRQYVYDTLVQHAETTQADLRSELDRLNIRYTPYYLENGLKVHAGFLIGQWLAGRPDVDRVLNNPYLRPLPAPNPEVQGPAGPPAQLIWNLDMINVTQVWEMGISGQGIIVGQSDSGVQYNHPELANGYRGRDDGHDYNWHNAWFSQAAPYDVDGHGTHTLAIAVGDQVGVAPNAEWIGCLNMARNFGNPAYYLDCLQFLFAPFPHGGDPLNDGRPELGAHILNNSWGCPPIEGCDTAMLAPALAALRSAGVFVVVSAGNSGAAGCESVSQPPALHTDVYSVGAISVQGQLASFSSIGPVTVDGSGRLKPELVAPGVDVLSAFPGNTYILLSGTSMAAPHVTGTVALMWSANPDLIGNIDRTEEILGESAGVYTGSYPACILDSARPNPAVGYGILDAAAAVQLALDD
jgi:subtilisin family serine protease